MFISVIYGNLGFLFLVSEIHCEFGTECVSNTREEEGGGGEKGQRLDKGLSLFTRLNGKCHSSQQRGLLQSASEG